MSKLAFFVSALMLVACGDDGTVSGDDGTVSGVPGEQRLSELSDGEHRAVCDYAFEILPATHSFRCDDGHSYLVGFFSVVECVADQQRPASCAATVEQAEACYQELASLSDAELCAVQLVPPACDPLFTPACTGLD